VVVFALACSLLVALSLVPMLASRLLAGTETRGEPGGWTDRLARRAGRGLAALENGYVRLLEGLLRRRWTTALATLALVLASLVLVPRIGTEFLPPSDEGEVRVTGEMEVGTRLGLIDRQTRRMEEIVYAAVPEAVASVVSVVTSGTRGSARARGEIRLSLVPAAERERANTEIAADLRERLEGVIPGMQIRTRAPQGQFLLERILAAEEGVTVEVRGFDLDVLDALALRVAEAIADVPGVTDVERSREAGIPQREIRVDRDKVADLGLSVRDVTEVIETAVAGSKAGEYRVEGNAYRILVQLEDAERRSLEEILDLSLHTPAGETVALRNLVETRASLGPVTI
jgi:HAE1 family hydrophobic/amphiphilic exporter-1